MDAGRQCRSRATSPPTFEYFYLAPCARPKTSDGNTPSRLRYPPRPTERYRCEPTPPEPTRCKRHTSPSPSSSYHWVREDVKVPKPGVPAHKQSIEAWVDEQVHLADRSNHHDRTGRATPSMGKEELRQRMWDELVYEYEAEAHKWMNHEAEMRKRAQEETRRRIVQEDIRRIQARVRQRRDSERQAIADERKRAAEKARNEQDRAERAARDAWQTYESAWAALSAPASETLVGFRDVPWPVLVPPAGVADLTPERVAEFLLHSAHSADLPRRERIRNALLRWHPDRFCRVLNRVVESEKSEVEEGVGVVARCLNELLAKEKAQQQAKM